MKAEEVCRLVLPRVHTGGGGNRSALPVPSHWGKAFLIGESGTVVPLLMNAASAPGRLCHAGTGSASSHV